MSLFKKWLKGVGVMIMMFLALAVGLAILAGLVFVMGFPFVYLFDANPETAFAFSFVAVLVGIAACEYAKDF